jgi:hypothetical protein
MLNDVTRIDPMTFFYRDGRPVAEQDLLKVQHNKRTDSGWINRRGPCSRCGGQGGADAWKYTGYVCYRCGGHNSMYREHYTDKVYTAEKLATLVEAADRKAAKKAAAAEKKAAAEYLKFVQWGRQHKKLLGDIIEATGNSFLTDLASKLADNQILTDRQLEAAATAIERQKKRIAENAASDWVGSIKERIEFEAEVVGVYGTEGYYGHTDIVKLKDGDNNQFTWFASDYTNLERSDRISIKGTIKAHDEFRGIKQTVLTRCKFEKFQVMTADEAAAAEHLGTGERVTLIYPENRSVPASQIFTWHSDAVANGEVEEHTSDLKKAIYDLEDIGFITVGKG